MEQTKNYPMQICQDPDINDDFRKLHHDMVNMVIKFCKDHDIEIDDFYLSADGVSGSIPYERWQACTDSSFSMYQFEPGESHQKEKEPYLWSI